MAIEVVTVFGSSAVPEDHPDYEEARKLGGLLAQEGFTVANGGYGGVMAAVSRGAKEAGGRTIGVTSAIFSDRSGANPWIDREIRTKTLQERLEKTIGVGDAHIAMPGGPGTFAEIELTWNLLQRKLLPKDGPLILVGQMWDDLLRLYEKSPWVRQKDVDILHRVLDVEEAVRIVVDANHRNG
jgi:hypothetical protein